MRNVMLGAAAAVLFSTIYTSVGAQAPAQPPPGQAGGGRGRGGQGFPATQRALADAATIERGNTLYGINCRLCHGPDLRGGDMGGINLLRSPIALSDQDGELIFPVVRDGRNRPGQPPMPPLPLSESDVKAFIDKAVAKYGRLDAIWANAGVSGGLVPLAEQTVDHWQEVLRVNLIGPFLAIKHSMPHMIRQKSGSIVCTASVAGLKAGASGHPYGASKAGVISLVQTTAYSLSGTGVRINAVCPGLIETGMTKPVFDRAKERGTQDKIGQLNPLKRPGQPHELAAMGLFLASDEASYVNGQAIPVDGGLTASMPYTGKPV